VQERGQSVTNTAGSVVWKHNLEKGDREKKRLVAGLELELNLISVWRAGRGQVVLVRDKIATRQGWLGMKDAGTLGFASDGWVVIGSSFWKAEGERRAFLGPMQSAGRTSWAVPFPAQHFYWEEVGACGVAEDCWPVRSQKLMLHMFRERGAVRC
jgi:hypothetical protein